MENQCKIKTDAVIFDKDGTLIDFDAFWVSLSDAAVTDLLVQFGQDRSLTDEILQAFGIRDGVTDVNGVLCKGTYAQMAQITCDVLARHGLWIPAEELEPILIAAYNKNFRVGRVKPTCPNLREVLTTLKSRSKQLAVVTTDNREITLFCLEQLGVARLFDKIYTDDGVLATKPNPACAIDFCTSCDLDTTAVVMVGDTMTDLTFARNAGLKMVGLAKTEESSQIFRDRADVIIRDPSELLDILE